MKAIQKVLSSIRQILGITSSIRQTANGVKREANTISRGIKGSTTKQG